MSSARLNVIVLTSYSVQIIYIYIYIYQLLWNLNLVTHGFSRCCVTLAMKNAQPSVITGQKWKAKIAVENAKCALIRNKLFALGQMEEQAKAFIHMVRRFHNKQKKISIGRNSPSWGGHVYCDSYRTKETGRMDEWESTKDKCVKWGDLKHREPLKLTFVIKAIYDVLPTLVNLHARGLTISDQCSPCGKTACLKHILTRCEYALRKYTWIHNEVFKMFAVSAKICCETTNKALNDITNRVISKLFRKNKYRS